MSSNARLFVGMLALVVGLLAYIIGVVTVATTWLPSHWAAQMAFFAVAGIAWAIPLRPFMAWMKGRD